MRKTTYLFFLILYCLYSTGQPQLDFDVLSIDDGFSSSRATTIIQDRAGFIWVGTWNGLNRYDGYECVVYQPGLRDSTTLSNREVTALMEDRQGYIWIGTTYGLNKLNPLTKHIKVFPLETRILSLFEDKNGSVWIGTEGEGLFHLDVKTEVLSQSMAGETVHAVIEDSREEFWMATGNGLVNFDRKTKGYKRYFHSSSSHYRNERIYQAVYSIDESEKGELWVGLEQGGVAKIIANDNKDSLRIIHYPIIDRSGHTCTNYANRLLFDGEGNLWIGTWGGGVYMLEKNEQGKSPEAVRFLSYKTDVNDPFGMGGNNYISSLLVDRSGTLWAGSSVINIASIRNKGIERFNTQRIDRGKISNHWIRTIKTDKDGKVWLGSSEGLLVYDTHMDGVLSEDNLSGVLQRLGIQLQNALPVNSILPDRFGYQWIATENNGLFLLPSGAGAEKKNDRAILLNTQTDPAIPSNQLMVVHPSKKYPSVVWIGTLQNGLIKCEYKKGKFIFESFYAGRGQDYLSDNKVRTIFEDRDGKVWIGTQHGLNCFDPETRRFDRFFYSAINKKSINDNVVNCIFEDSNGALWIGTNAGLNKKEITVGADGNPIVQFVAFPDQPWINNQVVMNLLEDDHQNLWIGIYNGLLKFNLQTNKVEFEFFDKAYQRIKILHNSSCRDSKGNFLFGGGTGFLRFHPDSIQKLPIPTTVQITNLLIFNKKVPVGDEVLGRKVLSKDICYTDSITLNYKHGVFSVVFSGMSFITPDKTRYSYILEGYDKDWNEVGNRNTATYTGIPHGRYVFRVKASDGQNNWSEQTKNLYIRIKPPIWKTHFAYIVYGMLVMGMLYFFKQFSIIRHKEKSRMLLAKVQFEKEHELNELKESFFTNITHEFRTPLTLILAPLQEMLDQKNKFGFYSRNLELIQRNAQRLLRLINQLMEFRKIEKGKMELNPQKVDLIMMLNELCDSFLSMAESKKIDFSLQNEEAALYVWIDYDKFDKVLFNLLSNAFKFTDEGGKIVVRTGYTNDEQSEFFVEIEDNGIGIPPGKKDHVFERFYQVNQKNIQSTGGIGLHLSKAFVELHQGSIYVESELGKGSIFKVIMPVRLRKDDSQDDAERNLMPPNRERVAHERNKKDDFSSYEMKEYELELKVDDCPEPYTGTRPVVLIVEDDQEMNEFIANSLSPYFNIRRASNGKDALEMVHRLNPDLILSDIMMPEMDGLEFGRLVLSDMSTSHIPILFLTAKSTKENEVEGLQAGAVDYISKPFNVNLLRLKITNILARRKALHDYFHKGNLLEPESITLTSLDEQFLKDAVEAVNKYLDDPEFDVEKLSDCIKLSSNQTYRKIKALTGQTAKEFIRSQRLKTAAKLLLQKKRTVSEIIYMVGFSSPSYFTRCFREYFGVTPSEFIEKEGKI